MPSCAVGSAPASLTTRARRSSSRCRRRDGTRCTRRTAPGWRRIRSIRMPRWCSCSACASSIWRRRTTVHGPRALSLYGTHPVRAAAEMRYMLQTMAYPSERFLTDGRVPVELRVAMVGNMRPSPATWTGRSCAKPQPARVTRCARTSRSACSARSRRTPRRRSSSRASFPAWRRVSLTALALPLGGEPVAGGSGGRRAAIHACACDRRAGHRAVG